MKTITRKRRNNWIVSIEGQIGTPRSALSSQIAEEAVAGLDVEITAVERSIDSPSIQVYAKATESMIQEYVGRLLDGYGTTMYRIEYRAEKRVGVLRRGEKPVPGDVFAVPLTRGHYGHVRMIQNIPEMYAESIEYLDLVTVDRLATVTECEAASVFLAPAITMIAIGVSHWGWMKIGNIARESAPLRFRESLMWSLTGSENQTDWRILEPGKGWIRCGALPEAYRLLPRAGCDPPLLMAEQFIKAKGFDWYISTPWHP